MESVGTWYWYTGFALLVILAVVVDLLVLGNKKDELVSFRQALVWSMFWVALGACRRKNLQREQIPSPGLSRYSV